LQLKNQSPKPQQYIISPRKYVLVARELDHQYSFRMEIYVGFAH